MPADPRQIDVALPPSVARAHRGDEQRSPGALAQQLGIPAQQPEGGGPDRPQPGDADPMAADVEQFVAMGQAVLTDGDATRALSIFEQVAELAPDHVPAIAGHAQALLQLGRVNEAEALLAAVPADKAICFEVPLEERWEAAEKGRENNADRT